MIVRDRRTDAEWARDNVERFPRSWRARLLTAWHRAHHRDRRTGNLSLLARVRTLSDAERAASALTPATARSASAPTWPRVT